MIKQFEPKVALKWATPNGDQLIGDMARVSVKDNEGKPVSKLIKYLADHKHWSPFSTVNMCVEVHAPRDISRQILRHWSIHPQEFCIAGDSRISVKHAGGTRKKIPIADLYARQQAGDYNGRRGGLMARVYDETSKLLVYAPIREVFHTGIKPVYRVSIGNNKQKTITSTAEHKFLCRDGVFRPLHDISVGDFVALNGIPVYQSSEWMADAKTRSLECGGGLGFIAAEAGCTTHTVRKWLKKHGMQFTKKEVATYTPVWNKGLPADQQPMYGNTVTADTRAQMKASARHGAASNLYKGGVERSWRRTVQDECDKWKLGLVRKQDGMCDCCGATVAVGDGSEIDHKKPVSLYPELAFSLDNLHVLCSKCHADKTSDELRSLHYTIRWGRVNSIVSAGTTDTYDLEVDHTSHNYVANGIVVHNSRRYSIVNDTMFVTREARTQHPTNRQMSVSVGDDENSETLAAWWEEAQQNHIADTKAMYDQALSRGIAKECARVVLPEGNTMSRLYLNGTVRTWIHYLQVRTDINATQREHVAVAKCIEDLFAVNFPIVYKAFFDTPEYELVHTAGVGVCKARTAEDVYRWATTVWGEAAEIVVSFQPGFNFCRVTITRDGETKWVDYNLFSTGN